MKTLIVEDDLMTQCVLAKVLTERGHEVVSYENAEQAVLAYQKEFYPLLFVDAGLPGMGGLQFCKWVRSQPNGEKIFIMVATEPGQPGDMSEILASGANDFLPKPFEVTTLSVRLAVAERQMKDFFERKGLEDNLRQSQESFHRVVKTSNDGAWLFNAQFRTEYVSPQMAEMLGCQVEDLAGSPVIDFVPHNARRECEKLIAQQENGKDFRREFRFRRKDGSECVTFVSATAIRSETGEFVGALWMAADMTKSKALAEETQEARQKLENQLRDLKGKIDEAVAAAQSEAAERKIAEQALQQTQTELETRLREQEAERARASEEAKEEAANRKQAEEEFSRTRLEFDAKAEEAASDLGKIREALQTEAGRRKEIETALDQARKELEAKLQKQAEELGSAKRDFQNESGARKQAEEALLKARGEMESAARQHADEQTRTKKALETEAAERTRQAEAFQKLQRELESHDRRHADELARADRALQSEISERKRAADSIQKAEQELSKVREELSARLKELTAELLKANQEIKAEGAERKRLMDESMKAREELSQRVKDHMTQMVKAGDELRAAIADRMKEMDARKSAEDALRQTKVELESKVAEGSRANQELKLRLAGLAKANEDLSAEVAASKQSELRIAAFSKLGRELCAARTAPDSARIVANVAQELLGWDACSVELYSAEENRIQPVLNIDTVNGRPADVPPHYAGPQPSPIMQRVIADGPQLILRSGPSNSHTDFLLFGDRARLSTSLMYVSIKAGAKVVGFLSVQSYTPDAYDQTDLQTLEALADHCGGSLERIHAGEIHHRSEERFQLVARATNDIVRDWNVEADKLWWNDAFSTVLGYQSGEVEPGIDSWKNRLHPEEKEKVVAAFHHCLERGEKSWSEEYRLRRRDGSYAHVIDRGYVMRNENKKAVRMIGAMVDVSQRKQVEEAMIEGQARKGAILETALDGIVTIDHEGKIFEWNPAAEKMFGHRRADVLGEELAQFIVPQSLRDKQLEDLTGHFASGGGSVIGKRIELAGVRAGGGEFPIELAISRIPTDGPPIFTGFIRDITERKRTEMEIQKLAAFPRWNPNPVFEFSADGHLTYFNDAASEMALALGKEHPSAILPENVHEIAKDCLSRGHNRLRLETAIGGRTVSWSFFPVISSRVVHCYAVDITERASLEAQLRQAQKMESVGQLAAGVAHDFNNLLGIVQGYSALMMEDKDLKSESLDALKQIDSATQRATHLTRQLLTFSRKQSLHIQTLDLNEVINSVSKLLHRVLGESVAVQFNYCPNLPPVEADTGMMEQVAMNLSINARDAMPQGGQLTIGIKPVDIPEGYAEHNPEAREGRFVCLSVSDTGCGMDEATLGRIFEPFFTTKPSGKGTGLGLATVYGIVKQHRGWIEVQSQVSSGTTFRVYLPASSKAIAPAAGDEAKPAAVLGGSETILLVEDEPAVLAMAKGILERQGYKILPAVSGDDALLVWQQNASNIDLLLTDMVMPGAHNGRELAAKLRSGKPELKVIYTSGYSIELLGNGMTASKNFVFLQKPYHPDAIAQIVRNCLDGTLP